MEIEFAVGVPPYGIIPIIQLYHYYLLIFLKLYLLIIDGYYYNKEKSSKNYKVIKNDNEDKIIIFQTKSGNYLYFNKTANNN